MLDTIVYPAGGKTAFEFESNVADTSYYGYTNTNNGVIGGLRIKSIKNISNSDTLYKSYAYSKIGATTPIQSNLYHWQQEYTYIDYNVNVGTSWATTVKDVMMSAPLYPLTTSNQSPIIYSQVTEYAGKDSIQNTGKTVFQYDLPMDYNYNFQPVDMPRLLNSFHYDRGTYTPRLTAKKIYKQVAGTYSLISSLGNIYTHKNRLEFNTGLKFDRRTTYVSVNQYREYISSYDYVREFIYSDTKGYTDVDLLTQTRDTIFDTNGSYIVSKTLFQYDSTTLFVISDTTFSSKGDTIVTLFHYPLYFNNQSPYTTMVFRNILNPIIEKISYKNNIFLQSVKTNYGSWGNNIIAPATIQSQVLNNAAETRLHFYNYDNKGNVVSVAKENDSKSTYIWDYTQTLPVAEIRNADSASVAYTSFEADGSGNWSIGSNLRDTTTAITGSKSYNLSNGSISKSGLTTSRYYRVSYWTKNNSAYSITGNATGYPKQGKTVNGWTYFEHRITGQVQ